MYQLGVTENGVILKYGQKFSNDKRERRRNKPKNIKETEK